MINNVRDHVSSELETLPPGGQNSGKPRRSSIRRTRSRISSGSPCQSELAPRGDGPVKIIVKIGVLLKIG